MAHWIRSVSVLMALLAITTFNSRRTAAEDRMTASKDGVSIAYQVSGQGSPAIVFVHCWSCDRSYWDAQVAYFSKQHRILTVDLAGHGASGLNRQQWTLPSLGEDVAAAVTKEQLDRVVLVGHSMGGAVCLEAARILGNRVIAVVGADTLHDLDQAYSPDELKAFMAPFEADFPKAAEGFIRSMFPPTADPALVNRIAKDMASAPPNVALACFRALFTYKPQPTLATLHVPIFAINADKYPTKTEAITRHGLTFEVKLMKGYGHFVAQENPVLFNSLLDEILAGLPAANVTPKSGKKEKEE